MTPQQAIQIIDECFAYEVTAIHSRTDQSAVQRIAAVQQAIRMLAQHLQPQESSNNTERKRKK